MRMLQECQLALGLLAGGEEDHTTMAFPDDENSQQDPYEGVSEPRPLQVEPSGLNQWLLVIALVLMIVVAVAIGFSIHAQNNAKRLVSANSQLALELTQTQNQLADLTAKLNALTASAAAQPGPPADETLHGKTVGAAKTRVRIRRRPVRPVKSLWQLKMQRQLADQRERIAATEQAISKALSDLASESASAQNSFTGLGSSIAKDHAQLVALEQLGQRNYYEFDLFKSKRFTREGPVGLALRHTNTRRQNYSVELLIDDSELGKKNVGLYEPVVLQTTDSPMPVELVVNRIGKNQIHGYVSAPKSYSERQSASTVTPGMPSTAAPVATDSTQTIASASRNK